MQSMTWLLALLISGVFANTEKLMFQAGDNNQCASLAPVPNGGVLAKLHPPFSQTRQTIFPTTVKDNSSSLPHWFKLRDIQAGSNYELRISYPAITPADFYLTLMDSCQLRDYLGSKGKSVPTDHDSGTPMYWLLVEAHWTGVDSQTSLQAASVTYDIVLETLYLGFLFYNVYKVVIAIFIVLVFGQWVALPFVKQLIYHSVEFKVD